MLYLTLQAQVADFDIFDDVTPVTVELTERQLALLFLFFALAVEREVWEPIEDTAWQSLQDEIEIINARLHTT